MSTSTVIVCAQCNRHARLIRGNAHAWDNWSIRPGRNLCPECGNQSLANRDSVRDAAPELLAVLKRMKTALKLVRASVESAEDAEELLTVFEEAEIAIAKAEGEL